jgi:hypothetical protein
MLTTTIVVGDIRVTSPPVVQTPVNPASRAGYGQRAALEIRLIGAMDPAPRGLFARNCSLALSFCGQSFPTPEAGMGLGGQMTSEASVDLYWIPLGAGAHVVRISGKIYEAIVAIRGHRSRFALYHSALEIRVPEGRFIIESAPVINQQGEERGVVAAGPVGMKWAGRFRLFRYEIRRWRDGSIPDANEAVSSPISVVSEVAQARRILELVPAVPTPVWGRDELNTGDMWNSNSLISWLLERGGVNADRVFPPSGGRAPGWNAGIQIARRINAQSA